MKRRRCSIGEGGGSEWEEAMLHWRRWRDRVRGGDAPLEKVAGASERRRRSFGEGGGSE